MTLGSAIPLASQVKAHTVRNFVATEMQMKAQDLDKICVDVVVSPRCVFVFSRRNGGATVHPSGATTHAKPAFQCVNKNKNACIPVRVWLPFRLWRDGSLFLVGTGGSYSRLEGRPLIEKDHCFFAFLHRAEGEVVPAGDARRCFEVVLRNHPNVHSELGY